MSAEYKCLRFILPARLFAVIEAGAREWLIEYSYGYEQDFWNVGGVRYRVAGTVEIRD